MRRWRMLQMHCLLRVPRRWWRKRRRKSKSLWQTRHLPHWMVNRLERLLVVRVRRLHLRLVKRHLHYPQRRLRSRCPAVRMTNRQQWRQQQLQLHKRLLLRHQWRFRLTPLMLSHFLLLLSRRRWSSLSLRSRSLRVLSVWMMLCLLRPRTSRVLRTNRLWKRHRLRTSLRWLLSRLLRSRRQRPLWLQLLVVRRRRR